MNERYHSQQDNYSWHTEDLASRDFQDWKLKLEKAGLSYRPKANCYSPG